MKGLFQLLKKISACGRQASIAYARLRARPPVSLRSCLAPALRASLIAYRRIAYKSTLTVVGAWTLSWATGQVDSGGWVAGMHCFRRGIRSTHAGHAFGSLGEVPERPRGAGSASDRWSVCEGPQARVGGSTVDPTFYVLEVDP